MYSSYIRYCYIKILFGIFISLCVTKIHGVTLWGRQHHVEPLLICLVAVAIPHMIHHANYEYNSE